MPLGDKKKFKCEICNNIFSQISFVSEKIRGVMEKWTVMTSGMQQIIHLMKTGVLKL